MNRAPHSERRHSASAGRGVRHAPRLDQKLSPEEINRLPMAAYDGPIHVVRTPPQMLAAAKELRHETLLGFDTETRPSFRKGESHPPALIQLAGREAVYLFQLHALGLPAPLTDILANPRIIKAGVANHRDLQELRALAEFQPRGFVDLGACAKRCGMQHHGLRGLAALLLGCRISKAAQLTNWAQADLPAPALRYAATDAWISRRIFGALKECGCLGDSTPAAGAPAQGVRGLWQQAKATLARMVRKGTTR